MRFIRVLFCALSAVFLLFNMVSQPLASDDVPERDEQKSREAALLVEEASAVDSGDAPLVDISKEEEKHSRSKLIFSALRRFGRMAFIAGIIAAPIYFAYKGYSVGVDSYVGHLPHLNDHCAAYINYSEQFLKGCQGAVHKSSELFGGFCREITDLVAKEGGKNTTKIINQVVRDQFYFSLERLTRLNAYAYGEFFRFKDTLFSCVGRGVNSSTGFGLGDCS